jgi:hypothetical protein
MAIFACARRKSDGLLTWAQSSPQAPDQSAIIQNGIDSFGGVANDWEYAELTVQQYDSLRAAMPGRSYLVSGELSSQPAPDFTVDKDEIEDDGVDEAIITFDVGDAGFAGNVTFIVSAPDGSQQTSVQAAVAGVASLSITTLLIGIITIDARAEAYGDGIITVEGI